MSLQDESRDNLTVLPNPFYSGKGFQCPRIHLRHPTLESTGTDLRVGDTT